MAAVSVGADGGGPAADPLADQLCAVLRDAPPPSSRGRYWIEAAVRVNIAPMLARRPHGATSKRVLAIAEQLFRADHGCELHPQVGDCWAYRTQVGEPEAGEAGPYIRLARLLLLSVRRLPRRRRP